MRRTRTLTVIAAVACAGMVLAGCSSAEEAASAPASAVEAAESAAGAVDQAAMESLCAQMVAEGLSPDEATALATENGYVARVGTIDGEPQALTMDFREDRFTFEVTDGAVVSCTYG
jgi:PBP1b-binding outer membrane lipoprotein LpoB